MESNAENGGAATMHRWGTRLRGGGDLARRAWRPVPGRRACRSRRWWSRYDRGSGPEARTLTAALAARQVISDFCAPDVGRFGAPPLRSSFADVLAGVGALRALLLD